MEFTLEGKIEAKIEIARSMKRKGFAIVDISEMTGLTVTYVEALLD